MNDDQFDRIARLFSRVVTRRGLVAGVGGAVAARSRLARAASQLETAACGEAGAVCTDLMGCCTGMVCATSFTNPAYGVCVAGEGDMLPVSDSIVVPGADGITDELAQDVSDATSAADSTPTTDPSLTQGADIQARRAAKRTTNNTQQSQRRLNHGDTHANKLANETENRTAAQNKRAARALKRKPNIKPELIKADPKTSKPETLYIENRDNESVVISRVQSIDDKTLFTSPNKSIAPDDIYLLKTADWTDPDQEICNGIPGDGDGVIVTAAKYGSTKKYRFTALCS
jgi:hypothetical protein